MASFENVAVEYDAARPAYPSGVYEALDPLDGALIVDCGAGTGIATRQLMARGATVIAVDPGRGVLSRAAMRTPDLVAVVADGAMLPLRDQSIDMICFAQSWHWLDETRRCQEAHRVLRSGGRWAGWWSHARADHEDWFDAYWTRIETACPTAHRDQRDIDWGAGVADSGLFTVDERLTLPWTRTVSIDQWMTDQTSHSYIAAMTVADRQDLMHELREVLSTRFPTETMRVPYETWLWIGRK